MNNQSLFEQCRNNLSELSYWYEENSGNRNEATTRFRMIDTLFFECLGWTKDDMISEDNYNGEYADYTFIAPRKLLIVEAKREGNYFELPVGQTRLEYSIQSLIKDYPNLKSAIEQVTNYCQSRGVPFAAVCNGFQLVVFIATRSDGLPPFEGKALVFHSLACMLDNFLDLWQHLSKPGIQVKNLYKKLIGDIAPELPSKLSMNIFNYPGIKGRNIFQTDLKIVSELVLEDLIGSHDLEKRFLEECYCDSGALSQYALVSKSILQAKYAALYESNDPGPTAIPIINKNGVSPELLTNSISRRPVLLIGDVGVGKTTFIRNLINVEASQIFDNAITFYLDLGSKANLSFDIRSFIIDEIAFQLNEQYKIDVEDRNFVRGIYHSEIEKFKKSIYGDLINTNPILFKEKEIGFLEAKINDKENHLKHTLQHISKAHKKQIIIFLDNCDQRSYETQQAIFLISQEIAEHWPSTVFVSLRPETFHHSVRMGALSGYNPKAFTVSPPRIDKVIFKRLQFAIKLANGEIPISSLPENIKIKLSSLASLLVVFVYSLENNIEIGECIDNIAGGNVRLALDIVIEFFGSGHIDTEKIKNIYDMTRKYLIPIHEFLRAVIFGDNIYFDPGKSIITNLFDITRHDRKEHFILPLIISMLESSGRSGLDGGFVETIKIYERMQGLGFTPEQIDNAIIKGCNKKLIETSGRKLPKLNQSMPHSLRATTVGVYHVTKLTNYFTYYDAVLVDTPILDEDTRLLLRDVGNIEARLTRAEYFCNYLDNCWIPLISKSTTFDWAICSKNARKNIEYIRKKATAKNNNLIT